MLGASRCLGFWKSGGLDQFWSGEWQQPLGGNVISRDGGALVVELAPPEVM